jgi:hypothetical protein
MKRNIFLLIFSITVSLLFCSGCKQKSSSSSTIESQIEIKGIYGSPDSFWKKGIRLDSLGVNSIFLSKYALTEEIMERAANERLKVFAEFPVLNGEDYVEDHPEAWAIDSSGNKVSPASWFLGVCPTEPGFRSHRMNELKELVRKFDVDGVWLDYVHWHAQFEEPVPILPETCFCKSCISGFNEMTGIDVPGITVPEKARWILNNHEAEWRSWRCKIITIWAADFKDILNKEKPGALLGLYHCPWNDTEFNGARRRILGLDYDMLKNIADVFSPMVYHGRMGREPEWVKENVEWLCDRLSVKKNSFPKVWPIVQAYNDPYVITPEEFENVLKYGMSGNATGVMMFTGNAVSESEEKTGIMKKVYSGESAITE